MPLRQQYVLKLVGELSIPHNWGPELAAPVLMDRPPGLFPKSDIPNERLQELKSKEKEIFEDGVHAPGWGD